jgi:hypothetical protein
MVKDKARNLVVFLAQLRKGGKDLVCQGILSLDQVQLATA